MVLSKTGWQGSWETTWCRATVFRYDGSIGASGKCHISVRVGRGFSSREKIFLQLINQEKWRSCDKKLKLIVGWKGKFSFRWGLGIGATILRGVMVVRTLNRGVSWHCHVCVWPVPRNTVWPWKWAWTWGLWDHVYTAEVDNLLSELYFSPLSLNLQ